MYKLIVDSWNSLPSDIRFSSNLSWFKRNCRNLRKFLVYPQSFSFLLFFVMNVIIVRCFWWFAWHGVFDCLAIVSRVTMVWRGHTLNIKLCISFGKALLCKSLENVSWVTPKWYKRSSHFFFLRFHLYQFLSLINDWGNDHQVDRKRKIYTRFFTLCLTCEPVS